MAPTSSPGDVRAAGAVVLRKGQVLLVHRPRYDDWAFPKGKLDRGEHAAVAAVREVGEETGLRVRLGVPLGRQTYPNGGRTKVVDYWVGRVLGDPDVSGYLVTAEIDEVAWVPVDKAPAMLTYRRDADTLREALVVGRKTRALVVLRHGQARARKSWKPDDRLRPLVAGGHAQAQAVVPMLAAYGLSEEDATVRSVRAVVGDLVASGEDAVLCTHRPVLPIVYDCLGVEPLNQATGELVVVHHRGGRVRSVERHLG
jgi:8-oxo-(d)GTP phosphatase